MSNWSTYDKAVDKMSPERLREALKREARIRFDLTEEVNDAKAKDVPGTKVVCPNCKHSLGKVFTSLIRQRGRFKSEREKLRKRLGET